MLRSYSAQLIGTELIWLSQPPAHLAGAKVLVVVDDVNPTGKQAPNTGRYDMTDLAGRLQWRGDAVAAQRAHRDAW